ncbi:hypothetical protein AMS68_004197 [Peltaster fructicola]|uniref:SGNH hydrolase-type esterase domain-containing protein n=1 Tax=Peltaster fructicola TaxID=286661 RepID=A0A6H0XW51_9PEZI|nr:hypothetical protein AMS68_004197 [Peltaster fructicola]
MKYSLIFSALACAASAANPLIAGVGSSYAAGPGVKKTIGVNLKAMLEAHFPGTTYDFDSLAVIGSHLVNVTKFQAPKLKGLSPDLIFFLSGGNDLNYVSCLQDATQSVCTQPEAQSTWQKDFEDALNAIFSNVANPTKVILYIATYPVALGPATNCGPNNPACRIATSEEVDNVEKLYNDQVDFTVAALNNWRSIASNSAFKTRLIAMRANSQGHEVGSQSPWVYGANASSAPWHPNDAGTASIAGYIYSNFTG